MMTYTMTKHLKDQAPEYNSATSLYGSRRRRRRSEHIASVTQLSDDPPGFDFYLSRGIVRSLDLHKQYTRRSMSSTGLRSKPRKHAMHSIHVADIPTKQGLIIVKIGTATVTKTNTVHFSPRRTPARSSAGVNSRQPDKRTSTVLAPCEPTDEWWTLSGPSAEESSRCLAKPTAHRHRRLEP